MTDGGGNAIRYAVIGLGLAGWNIPVKSLRRRADARVVAVVEQMTERAEESVRELDCGVGTSLDGVPAMPEVEVVVLATPSKGHAAEAVPRLPAGKHVVVEKPMAMDVAEAGAMIDAARQIGRTLVVTPQSVRESTRAMQLIRESSTTNKAVVA